MLAHKRTQSDCNTCNASVIEETQIHQLPRRCTLTNKWESKWQRRHKKSSKQNQLLFPCSNNPYRHNAAPGNSCPTAGLHNECPTPIKTGEWWVHTRRLLARQWAVANASGQVLSCPPSNGLQPPLARGLFLADVNNGLSDIIIVAV